MGPDNSNQDRADNKYKYERIENVHESSCPGRVLEVWIKHGISAHLFFQESVIVQVPTFFTNLPHHHCAHLYQAAPKVAVRKAAIALFILECLRFKAHLRSKVNDMKHHSKRDEEDNDAEPKVDQTSGDVGDPSHEYCKSNVDAHNVEEQGDPENNLRRRKKHPEVGPLVSIVHTQVWSLGQHQGAVRKSEADDGNVEPVYPPVKEPQGDAPPDDVDPAELIMRPSFIILNVGDDGGDLENLANEEVSTTYDLHPHIDDRQRLLKTRIRGGVCT
mmetsp:Transcript_44438/g.135451  ORF Transcript_44438/g.135451 Transcript_44438/m.135451 type:complete len:274 (+) Transcript_44438:843-1664(+)